MPVVKISGLTYADKGRILLDSIDLAMEQGGFLGIFGSDGSGKTTLLHVLMGFLTGYEGTAHVFEKEAGRWSEKERSQVRFVPDGILLEHGMTVEDYLKFAAHAASDYDVKLQDELCHEFEIPMNGRLLGLTYQENKFAQIIAAVCAKPKLLILDEPVNFLSEKGYSAFLDKLARWNSSGMSIILAAEKYADVRGYCKSYAYLHEGKIVSSGKVPQPDIMWKVITVMGKVSDGFEDTMEQCVSERKDHASFLYRGDMKKLPNLLERLDGRDFVVEEVSLEEQLDMDFSRWE